jgi:hypothetical protein
MSLPLLPIPEAYWVIPGRFLAGEYPAHPHPEQTRRRIDVFVQEGFDCFIDLTTPGELEPYMPVLAEEAGYFGRQVEYRRFSIGDFGLPSEETMKSILDTIDAALEAGKKIYVHCWGGVGRTGTVVGCYLVRHGMNGQQALIQLSQWWQKVPKSRVHTRSPETDRQAEFVRNWQG